MAAAAATEVDACIEALRGGLLLSEAAVEFVCGKLIEVFLDESNLHPVTSPVTVVGDVHGQFHDLLELFRIGGDVPATKYLFLGDFVDRGHFSIETISLLACLKLRYPDRVALVRGNHESRHTTMSYGFYAEVMARYKSARVWRLFTDMFDFMPLGAVVDNEILAVHGGLSPAIHMLDQIRALYRFGEIPFHGPIADLMWGDPSTNIEGFRASSRGSGYLFGHDVVDHFCHLNGISYIVRAHQLCMDGYSQVFDSKFITVWSAPNYCYRMKNMASLMEIASDHSYIFKRFSQAHDQVRQPNKLPFAEALTPGWAWDDEYEDESAGAEEVMHNIQSQEVMPTT